MLTSPKTVEEARQLPEITWDKLLNSKLGGRGIDGDSICAFTDVDGRFMRVVETEDGYFKQEVSC